MRKRGGGTRKAVGMLESNEPSRDEARFLPVRQRYQQKKKHQNSERFLPKLKYQVWDNSMRENPVSYSRRLRR